MPSADEAAQILDVANEDSQGIANPRLPWRFSVAMAALLAGVCAAQVLEGPALLIMNRPGSDGGSQSWEG